jgi:DNA-binding transcriptional ArsR family regulator
MEVKTLDRTQGQGEREGVSRLKARIVVSPLTDAMVMLSLIGDEKVCKKLDFEGEAKRLRSKMRPRLLSNLTRFFDEGCYPGMGLTSLIGNEYAKDVPSFLQALQTLPDEELGAALLSFGRLFRGNLRPELNIGELIHSRDALVQYIEQNMTVPAEKVETLADVITNLATTREDLGELIEYIWYVVLQPESEKRFAEQQRVADMTQARLQELGPLRLVNMLSRLHISDDGEYEEVIFAPKSVEKFSIVGTENEAQNALVMIYGEENEAFKQKAEEAGDDLPLTTKTLSEFCNLLGDEKRLEIVRYLVERPHYGQELAKLLGITNATVFYHLSMLEKKKLVHLERIEHRVYYVLNTDRLEKYLVRGTEFLLNKVAVPI